MNWKIAMQTAFINMILSLVLGMKLMSVRPKIFTQVTNIELGAGYIIANIIIFRCFYFIYSKKEK